MARVPGLRFVEVFRPRARLGCWVLGVGYSRFRREIAVCLPDVEEGTANPKFEEIRISKNVPISA